MKPDQSGAQLQPRAATPLRFLFVRVFWMALGPAVMLGALFSIVNSGTGWLTARDAVYVAALAATVALRWYDFRHGDPTKPTGEPATEADMRWYTVTWVGGGALAWVLANALGNHILGA